MTLPQQSWTAPIVRRLPGLERLRHYERGWLSVDLLAGLTVGAMLVPQGMAYAELADMPPVTGFYAALLALIAYAFVGSSRHLGVGPESGTAILAATGVGAIAAGDPRVTVRRIVGDGFIKNGTI